MKSQLYQDDQGNTRVMILKEEDLVLANGQDKPRQWSKTEFKKPHEDDYAKAYLEMIQMGFDASFEGEENSQFKHRTEDDHETHMKALRDYVSGDWDIQAIDMIERCNFEQSHYGKRSNNMRRVVQVFVADPDERLKAVEAEVFRSDAFFTDLDDSQLIATLPIVEAIEAHNEKRGTIEDRAVSRQFEKTVYLEDDLEIDDFSITVVTLAEF